MGLFSRRSARRPRYLPLVVPALDGTGWPTLDDVGRPSFDSLTLYELGLRNAFEDEAHDVAQRLVDAALPHVPTGVSEEDEPYLTKVFATAARIGAGVGMVERTLSTPDLDSMDRRIGASLWQARRKLPVMRQDWTEMAAYFLLAGYYVARTDLFVIPVLVEHLPPRAPDGQRGVSPA